MKCQIPTSEKGGKAAPAVDSNVLIAWPINKLPLALLIVSYMRKRNEINAMAETDRLLDIEREKVKNLEEELKSIKAKKS